MIISIRCSNQFDMGMHIQFIIILHFVSNKFLLLKAIYKHTNDYPRI